VESLKKVESLLTDEFTKGLESEGEYVMVKMCVTHIHRLPKGTEKGEFLIVDVGVVYLTVTHISELTFNDIVFLTYTHVDVILHEKA
jgi:hexokinase